MKVFGYFKDEPQGNLMELSDITVSASPGQLRELASFLLMAASGMEGMGAEYDHLHLHEVSDNHWTAWPDIIIAREE